MSSQESVGESRASHLTPGLEAFSEANHFGQATEEEMEADLKRVDAMEEDQEVSSRLQLGAMLEELQTQQFRIRLFLPMLNFLLMKI